MPLRKLDNFLVMDQVLLERIKEQVLPLLTEQAVELVELLISREKGRSVLRFLVDKSGGITLDECARLNQEIGQLLERENVIEESYLLEVSSPGLDRRLESTRDFQRVRGELVKIVLHRPIDKQNVWVGLLEEVDEENVVIRTEQKELQRICLANIARANLALEI